MKWRFTGWFCVLAVLCASTAAFAGPFLVCDPPPAAEGVTHYSVRVDTAAPVQVPAPLKYDLAGVTAGNHTIEVRAVRVDPLWGTLTSNPAPFVFTRPTGPGPSVGLALTAN